MQVDSGLGQELEVRKKIRDVIEQQTPKGFRQDRYHITFKLENSHEQSYRSPFGSTLPLTSYSATGRRFQDHAVDAAALQHKKELAKEQRKQNRNPGATWAHKLDASQTREAIRQGAHFRDNIPFKVQIGGGKGDRGQGNTFKGILEFLSDNVVTSESKPVTQKRQVSMSTSKVFYRNPRALRRIHEVENKVRIQVLKEFMDQYEGFVTNDVEGILQSGEGVRAGAAFLPQRIGTAAVCVTFRSRTVVTTEMMHLLLKTLKNVLSIDHVYFTPSREQAYLVYKYDKALPPNPDIGLMVGVPPDLALLETLDFLQKGETEFFPTHLFSDHDSVGPNNHYGLEMQRVLGLALKNATVRNSSLLQLQAVKDRHKKVPGVPTTPRAMAPLLEWPGSSNKSKMRKGFCHRGTLRPQSGLVRNQILATKPSIPMPHEKIMSPRLKYHTESSGDDHSPRGTIGNVVQHLAWTLTRTLEKKNWTKQNRGTGFNIHS